MFAAYSFYPILWDSAFYHLTAFGFIGYTRALYLQTIGRWSLVAFTVWLTCVNAFIDELFFDPQRLDVNEYIAFALIIFIVVTQKDKWIR